MLTFLIFALILSFLVFIHELGHYLAAKKFGVRVEEFGLGLPPKVVSKKIGETEYSLNLLPLGGYVKLTGEDQEEGIETAMLDERNFLSKKPWQRATILIAGIVMNILFAFIFFHIFIAANGFKSQTVPLFSDFDFIFGDEKKLNTVVMDMEDNSPAKKAGITYGEAIIEIDGKAMYSIKDIREYLADKKDMPVQVLLMDVKSNSKDTRAVTAVPTANADGKGQLGVMLSPAVTISYEDNKLFAGPAHAFNVMTYTAHIFSNLISTSVETKDITPVSSSVSGPVGIFGVVEQIIQTKSSNKIKDTLLHLVDLTASLSLSLGVMNLLPIPALDGGRLVFVLGEMISGKRIHPTKEAMVHRFGMLFLLGMIVAVTFKDFKNLLG